MNNTQYSFISFIDSNGNIQTKEYNDKTKDAIISKLTTESKPFQFEAIDYNSAKEIALKHFKVNDSSNKS